MKKYAEIESLVADLKNIGDDKLAQEVENMMVRNLALENTMETLLLKFEQYIQLQEDSKSLLERVKTLIYS